MCIRDSAKTEAKADQTEAADKTEQTGAAVPESEAAAEDTAGTEKVEISMMTLWAVSYTHLDVYKRQGNLYIKH